MKKTAVLLLTTLCFVGAANASIFPSLVGTPVLEGSGNYLYNYSISVAADQTLTPTYAPGSTCVGGAGNSCPVDSTGRGGAFWTIYDFQGLTGNNISTPTNWGYTTQFIGFTPTAPVVFQPGDSNAVTNVTFIYHGTTTTPGPVTINGFTLESTIGSTTTGVFSALATRTIGGIPTPAENSGIVLVPLGVPEPTSMVLIGGGLLAIAALRRKIVR